MLVEILKNITPTLFAFLVIYYIIRKEYMDSKEEKLNQEEAKKFLDVVSHQQDSRVMKVTLSGNEPEVLDGPAPAPINPETGMHKDHWILSQEERDKGFTRPVRISYRHVGIRNKYAIKYLSNEEREKYKQYGYVAFEKYPDSESPLTGRFYTNDQLEQLNSGCGVVTTMNFKIAQTYARDPKFYGATFCAGCGTYLPVEQFVWEGTDDIVGS